METAHWRVAVVGVANLLVFEVISQMEVRLDWRESTAELATLAELGLLVVAVMWASAPVFRHTPGRIPFTAALGMVLFVALYAVMFVYSWHIRPNVGLYCEPGWVSQHPGFQRELRQRIEQNRWSHASQSTSPKNTAGNLTDPG